MNHPAKNPFAGAAIEQAAADWIVRRDAGLTDTEERDLEAWFNADPRHAAALVWQEKTWGALDRPRQAGLADAMQERLSSSAARRRRRRVSAAAGMFALVVFAGVFWRQGPRDGSGIASTAPVPASVAVVMPEKRTLPDGSVVELRAGAEIAVDFNGTLRRIELRRGEAHFQVAKNPARPFVVVAGRVEVRAVGTAFAVEFAARDVGVLVTEGKVSVAVPTAADAATHAGAAAEPVFLTAWQRVVIPAAAVESVLVAAVLSVADAEAAERLAWRGARLEFTETPLATAIAMMNQHAGGSSKTRLMVEDAELGRRPITGLFRADNSEAFVRLLEASIGVKGERTGDTLTLRRR